MYATEYIVLSEHDLIKEPGQPQWSPSKNVVKDLRTENRKLKDQVCNKPLLYIKQFVQRLYFYHFPKFLKISGLVALIITEEEFSIKFHIETIITKGSIVGIVLENFSDKINFTPLVYQLIFKFINKVILNTGQNF